VGGDEDPGVVVDGLNLTIEPSGKMTTLAVDIPVSSYELNRQRNNRINGCNCRGIVVMFVQCIFCIDDKVK